MPTEALQTIGKWALALFFLGITIYIFYMVLFPKAGDSLWENIKSPIKFGQEKLEPGYHDIPPKIVENIERISNEISNDTNFDKETNINKKLKLNSLGEYRLAILKESDGKASFRVYFKDQIYPYDEEIDYVPCVVNAHQNLFAGINYGKVTLSQKIQPADKITFVNNKHFTFDNEERSYEFYGLVKIKNEEMNDKTEGKERKENICFVRLNNDGYEKDKDKK